MILRALSADFLKIRRKMIWFLVFLGPIGVVALTAVNFGLRYDYLTKLYAADLWGGLMSSIGFLSVPALMFGTTLITSMVAGIEHGMNSWKQLLALPISRTSVFTAKFLLCSLLLLTSCAVLVPGMILLGTLLGFGENFPIFKILQLAFYPFLAALPILALQLWLSVTMANQAVPLTVGIFGTILTMFSFGLPDWVVWKWPMLNNAAHKPEYSVYAGLAAGVVVLALALIDFLRRDVK